MIKIISDGSCDFSQEEVKKYNVEIVPFYISFDKTTFLKEGVDITKEKYFDQLLADKKLYPTTSQPNPQDFVDAYKPFLEKGEDLIVLTVSSKLSGSNQSANIAKNMMLEEYPERRIEVIDTLSASIGHYLIMKEVIKMNQQGLSMDAILMYAHEIIKSCQLYVTLDNLSYLVKGGRVGPTVAQVGSILGVKPILTVVDGEVKALERVRGKKKVLAMMAQGVTDALANNKKDAEICVGQIKSEEEAQAFKKDMEEKLGVKINNPIVTIGATIGTHAGPGGIGVAYCKKYEALIK